MITKEELLKGWNNGILKGSQRRLAERLHLNEASVSSWVSGRAKPSEESIKKMSKIFGKTEEELNLIFGMEKKYTSEVNLKKVIPLTDSNTISLPILAGVPAGLPEYSEKDVAYFTSIPRALFPGADFVVNVGKQSSRGQFDYLTSYYKVIERLAGLDKGTLHTLRHTFASHLVQNGVDLYTVSKLLGHSSIKMTEIYAHLAPDTLRQAIEKLPKLPD